MQLATPASIKRIIILVVSLALIFCVLVALVPIVFLMAVRSYPPQPKFGYKGDWHYHDVLGTVQRALPPASEVGSNYAAWSATDNAHTKLYVANLGGADRQSNFTASTNRGDTPLGARTYTAVSFLYHDPTNGTYRIVWSLPGKHDPNFLRFDQTFRLYELFPLNTNLPPSLHVMGIEGIEPENH